MDCPVCGASAEELSKTIDGVSLNCPDCGEYDISDTAMVVNQWQEMNPEQRRKVLTKAIGSARPAKRPKITTYLF